MSRLDSHVAAVQNRLALRRFLTALAWGSVGLAGAILLAVLIDRLLAVRPAQPMLWIYCGVGAVGLGALIWAMVHRPGPRLAAVAIDEKLGLKEKISTALFIRPDDDPFARAAVQDAEHTAGSIAVNLRRHFPLAFPRQTYASIAMLVMAAIATQFSQLDLMGRKERQEQQAVQQEKVQAAKKNVEKALATVESMPKTLESAEAIKLAKAELQAMLDKPIADPATANRTAVKALQDVNESIKQQIKNSTKFAQAQNEMKMLRSMQQPSEGQGPVADAHRAIARGEFTAAIDELTRAVENFEKMDKEQQAKATQQMKQLAQQLQQMANDPQQQERMQQQLQQLGMNQQQAQQAQKLMQQAAQGDKQAMNQLQQQAQQMMQQMNNGQGPTPQQQQQIQQMMQQMQAQANAQNQGQQMAQAAQQMAQAMQQAQQGQQPGQQPQQGQQQGQQMQQAMQGMQQQLAQMQAAAQDAQQIAAAQNAANAAQNAAQNAMNGNNGGGQQNGQGQWQGGNVDGPPNNQGQWQGQANPAGANPGGIGAGDRTYKQAAPYTVKQEIDQSQENEKGRILASNYIKDNKPFKGDSTLTLQEVARAAQQEQTDEIDQERISRQAQSAVKEYFGSMSEDKK